MNLKSLVHGITQSLNWHKERRHTFASMVIGLIDQKNVQHHAFSKSLNRGYRKIKTRAYPTFL